MNLDWYKKRAKQLKRAWENPGENAARAQPVDTAIVRRVLDDPGPILPLMSAQHCVAVEHGYTNWSALRVACGVGKESSS